MEKRLERKGFYIHYRFFDDGCGEEVESYVGPFFSFFDAYTCMDRMDREECISGAHVYYDTYVEEVK